MHDGPCVQPSQTFVEKEWKGCPDWIDKGEGVRQKRLHVMPGDVIGRVQYDRGTFMSVSKKTT